MHVALNAHLLSFGEWYRGAGISRYIKQLLVHLRDLTDLHDRGDRITVFLGDPRVPAELSTTPAFRTSVSRLPTVIPPVRMLWEQFCMPVELLRGRVDVLHSLGYVQPLLCPVRSVLTVHDLSFLRYPDSFNRLNRQYLRLLTRRSAHRANRIIAVSESTKRDLVDLLGVAREKVSVVHHGVEKEFRPLDARTVDRFRQDNGLPEHFILYCGTLEPRKSVDVLVDAYALLRESGILKHKLVIAGAKGWRFDRIFEAVERHGLNGDIIFPGYLPSAKQPLWYNAADVFVYPSRYEGFGFPPLEAMACGTPVVVSNSSSLPEVVGDAGIRVEQVDSESLAAAVRSIIVDEDLRREFGSRGLARAATFSWSRAARETVEVYAAL